MALAQRSDLRNIAIIAHVDHGKTTLVDGMLQQSNVFRSNQVVQERVMDSNDLERERGITILSKNTAITIPDADGNDVKINIIDTPGHADFGGEVERVLNMVDGVLLLVDAAEGPMPQTRFVLGKALELGHRVIVVINKIDRGDADPDRVLNETFDLFVELDANDEQLDFPVVYAIGIHQQSGLEPEVGEGDDLQPLFKTILEQIPGPMVDKEHPLQMLVTSIDYDKYKGLSAIGRVFAGTIKSGQQITRMLTDGTTKTEKVRFLSVQDGMNRVDVQDAQAGDIVAITGLEAINIGETLADPTNPIALPIITVEEPTVQMSFLVNNSPFAGQEGKYVTSRQIRARLYDELKTNVALRVTDTDSADRFLVSGRGELHLAILIETMRRQGYELAVARPEVIMRRNEETGGLEEPFEEIFIETTPETVGTVVEMLGKRRAEMLNMQESGEMTHLEYLAPTRGLLGFRHQFLTATRGMGILSRIFHGYKPMVQATLDERPRGSLVAFETGTATSFGLQNAIVRGELFIGPGREIYEGMVIGEHQRPGDLSVNVAKKKHLDNMRTSFKEATSNMAPPRVMSLDETIEYLGEDELLEVTPESLRIRKRQLVTALREREAKRKKTRETKS